MTTAALHPPGPRPAALAASRALTAARTAALAAKGRAGTLTFAAAACFAGAGWTLGTGPGLTITGVVLLALEWAREAGR